MSSDDTADDPDALSMLGEAIEAAAGSIGSARADASEHAKLAAARVQAVLAACVPDRPTIRS